MPPVRKKGGTVIVPVVEEELIVTKRLVLKEEIHLIKHSTKDRLVKEVELERERAEVRRLDAHGRVVDSHNERRSATPRPRRRGIL
jgi:stress response protein YsnF